MGFCSAGEVFADPEEVFVALVNQGGTWADTGVYEAVVAFSVIQATGAEEIQVIAVAKSGKERTGVLKNRQLAKLKVAFKITKNEVAPLEAKEIMIRVIDENDQVIFDVNRGSGSFIIDGKETFYTASQDILFDNSGQQLTFIYEKGSVYDPGTYKMEVFTDGYLMGAVSFAVK